VSVVMVGSAPRPFIGARRRGAAGGGEKWPAVMALTPLKARNMPCHVIQT
jgi:hypothetical protein